jgi:hypothetical protein
VVKTVPFLFTTEYVLIEWYSPYYADSETKLLNKTFLALRPLGAQPNYRRGVAVVGKVVVIPCERRLAGTNWCGSLFRSLHWDSKSKVYRLFKPRTMDMYTNSCESAAV